MSRYFQHVIAAAVGLSVAGYVTYLRLPSSEFRDPHIDNADALHPGDVMTFRYQVRWFERCNLEVARYLEAAHPPFAGAPGRERLIQTERQSVEPSPWQAREYSSMVQRDMVPGRYRVFSKIRLRCHWLDDIWPRVIERDSAWITIVP